MVLLILWFYNYVRGKGTNGYKKVKFRWVMYRGVQSLVK
jgi:hypothetical protein